MNRILKSGVLLILVVLAGCSSSVTRPTESGPVPASAPAMLSSANQVGEVTIAVSGDAKEELAENLKFNQNELLDHVKRAVEVKGLLNSNAAGKLPKLEITVTEVRVRSNFSAVMWGLMAGADHIKGTS